MKPVKYVTESLSGNFVRTTKIESANDRAKAENSSQIQAVSSHLRQGRKSVD